LAIETIEIECPKCKAKIRVHQHFVATVHDSKISQVTLIPSWSIDERTCHGCGSIVAPTIIAIQHAYAAYDPPKEQPRIIVPSLNPPRDLKIAGRG
jgi:hypothetical protein